MRAFAIVLVVLAGCASQAPQIQPYTPKHRNYEASTAAPQADPTRGSLYRAGRLGSTLFTDARALRADDVVEVKIEETADARRTADTDVARSSKSAANLNAFVQAMNQPTQYGGQGQFGAGSDSTLRANADTSRTEHFTATVPAIVRQVLPSGNLFVEGHRVVLVNQEEHHFYISGVVRPIDIDQQNSVKSSLIADAEIEFTGVGVLSDGQEQGWVSRHLGWLWPF
jgi:flagellar L-ring protein precursor FlgH